MLSAVVTAGWVAKYGDSFVDTPNQGSGALHYAASNGRLAVRKRKAFVLRIVGESPGIDNCMIQNTAMCLTN